MRPETARFLTLLLRPEWLALVPLAILPLLGEALRPVTRRAVPAGWDAESALASRRTRFRRWLVPALLATGFLCALFALAGPVRPVFPALEPLRRGHFWSILLDCSGSMSIVDPGRSASRLAILADDLAQAVQARTRTRDRFAVIRVAGYADRVGPASASSKFLFDSLARVSPALPGEDGTSLGDGLVLAADALPPATDPAARSILIVSDGRENPPDDGSLRLESVVPVLLGQRIRVDWLRLDLPAPADESPASREQGEASRKLLENLVASSGGTVISAAPGADRSAIFHAAMAKIAAPGEEISGWPSAATACLFAAFAFWSAAAVFLLRNRFARQRHWSFISFRGIAFSMALCGIAAAVISALADSRTLAHAASHVTSRWLLVLDASPSMAAADAAGGSRLTAARSVAQAVIDRLALKPGSRAGIVRFSGRAIPESGWTDDWPALKSIVEETDPYAIRPTGSDWDATLRAVSKFSAAEETAGADTVDTHVIFLTDGEPSREPGDTAIGEISNPAWRFHFVTFGDARPPGATFPQSAGSNLPWIDRRTGKAARSARNDTLAKRLAASLGGHRVAVGTAEFDPWSIAESIAGPVALAELRNAPPDRAASLLAFRLAVFAVAAFLAGQFAGTWARTGQRLRRGAAPAIAACVAAAFSASCSKPGKNPDFETLAESAWTAVRNENFIRAEAILAAASHRFPGEPVIPYDRALIELVRNRPQSAAPLLVEASRSLDRSGDVGQVRRLRLHARILAAQGYAELLAGRPEAASENYSNAIASGGLSDAEIADARTNADFAASVITRPRPGQSPPSAEPRVAIASSKSALRFRSAEVASLSPLADEVRARARKARASFEPAGDELKPGMKPAFAAAAIDW